MVDRQEGESREVSDGLRHFSDFIKQGNFKSYNHQGRLLVFPVLSLCGVGALLFCDASN